MTSQVLTRRDIVRYTAGRVAITVSLTGLVTAITVVLHLGGDLSATVPVGQVILSSILVSVIVSASLSAALSYRSALVQQQLTLARTELARAARTDPLTGLLNRRGFDEAATAILEQAQSDHEVVALMCDIDRFKSINDQFGHEFGDRVLAEIGGILRRFAEANDLLIARHGGEEFAALLVGANAEHAVCRAEALRDLCATAVAVDEASVQITVSIGLTSHVGEIDLSSIMRLADQALYQAKDRGRNRVVQIDVTPETAAKAA
ncbi:MULTISPECIES: GGDEF domain-containing protein [Rhodopseudomonas]|uniref:diguanylate cyclase n=1 Tax=Rhodopseudomonas palustris TaxID=1076 RepID=A0A0D7EGF3_RHOPL|nr:MULTISPECIES: GGDEF domain-containing protein [Rhodopseudomonas]KIZ39726.1 diguanylate cyclase [Rhodopseudomonas palustris]MDF3809630.1 GGDEF domain-containing protein [Rhodopseudomonas sp. BAL398]WOK20064.1 GGDEF domain-containing protein [Rhodopseudomonas sp. BAL398]